MAPGSGRISGAAALDWQKPGYKEFCMKKEFIMGQADGLERDRSGRWRPRELSPGLEKRLLERSAQQALAFFSDIFGKDHDEEMVAAICQAYKQGIELGLFGTGGVGENDFIVLRSLAEVVQPSHYIESGVFVGSSLYAFHSCPAVQRIWAIDPDLSNLKYSDKTPGRTSYIDSQDFSEIDFGELPKNTIAYFDDHINTMNRILQAHRKGIRILVFDDSEGFHGISQRIYPAVPSIGMLRNCDVLRAGDRMVWSVARRIGANRNKGPLHKARNLWRQWLRQPKQVSMTITEEMLTQMSQARDRIDRIIPLPNLLETLPLHDNEPAVYQQKYLVLLQEDNPD
jgi:hypothetical protein